MATLPTSRSNPQSRTAPHVSDYTARYTAPPTRLTTKSSLRTSTTAKSFSTASGAALIVRASSCSRQQTLLRRVCDVKATPLGPRRSKIARREPLHGREAHRAPPLFVSSSRQQTKCNYLCRDPLVRQAERHPSPGFDGCSTGCKGDRKGYDGDDAVTLLALNTRFAVVVVTDMALPHILLVAQASCYCGQIPRHQNPRTRSADEGDSALCRSGSMPARYKHVIAMA